MADVTISSLTPGTPSSTASIPFSDGSTTLRVAPGNILANAGNVGIGTTNPATKLNIYGGHGDTLLRLYSTGGNGTGTAGPAILSLWASEPGQTYTGGGIGANVNNSPYYGRVDSTNGQAYIRMIPQDGTMRFFTGTGDASQRMSIDSSGNVNVTTIGTLGTNAIGARTISTSSPTGGSSGDIWYQV